MTTTSDLKITITDYSNRIVYQRKIPTVGTFESSKRFFQKGSDNSLYPLTCTWHSGVGGFLEIVKAGDLLGIQDSPI